MNISRRLVLPAVVVALIAGAWMFGLTGLSWSRLATYEKAMVAWAEMHPLLAPLLFVFIYAASATLSLPQGALLTLLGGLLFGAVAGGTLAAIGATIGAVSLFLIAQSAFAEPLARRGGAALATLREELRRDGFAYLLALRLLPVVPFWLVNLAAPLCGMRLRPFVIATAIGILPVTFITASIGSGISELLANGERPDVGVIFSFRVLGPLLALAALSIAPVLWRKWRARHA